MTISSNALQGVILLQVISKTVSQFPFPYPSGSQQMLTNMLPLPPMSPPAFLPPSMSYPLQQKMPIVVMPYHSKSADKTKKKKNRRRRKKTRFHDSSCEEDSTSSSEEFDFRAKGKKRRQVLTPVVSYVTNDGYVVYQKKIKKDRAKDWLEMGRRTGARQERDERVFDREELLRKLKRLKLARKHHKDYV